MGKKDKQSPGEFNLTSSASPNDTFGFPPSFTDPAPSSGMSADGQAGADGRRGSRGGLMQNMLGGAAAHLQALDLGGIRKELEGPMPLRVICGLGGAAMAVAAAIGMINIFGLIAHPARFILQIYELIFGLLIMSVELKDLPFTAKAKEFAYKWFPFLTVMGGKGVFYLFAGSLGAAFGWVNLLLFIPAMFVCACGVLLILFHFGKCKQMEQKYDMTIQLSQQGGGTFVAPNN